MNSSVQASDDTGVEGVVGVVGTVGVVVISPGSVESVESAGVDVSVEDPVPVSEEGSCLSQLRVNNRRSINSFFIDPQYAQKQNRSKEGKFSLKTASILF